MTDDQMIISTLRKHKAYVTRNRIAVLKVLYESEGSISVSRIRKSAAVGLDRVSVYRTLQFLLEKGLVLAIPSSKGNPHYMLTETVKHASTDLCKDPLVYFSCTKCGFTEPVEQMENFHFPQLQKHKINNCYIVFQGICNNCK